MKRTDIIWLCAATMVAALSSPSRGDEKLIGIGIDIANNTENTDEEKSEWRLREFVIDGKGIIWAIAGKQAPSDPFRDSTSELNNLATFDPATSQWQAHPCLAAPGDSYPAHLAVLSNGSVVCLWQREGECALTVHSEGKDKRWSTMKTRFTDPRLLPLSDGGLVITERGPQLARIPADGTSPILLSLRDDILTKPIKEEGSRSYATTHAVECGDGGILLWNYALQKQTYNWHIDGLAAWYGEKIERLKGLPFKAESPISAITADGKEHLFVAEAGQGLWRLNWPKVGATRFAAPDHAFDYIEKLIFVNGVLNVVSCPQPDDIEVTVSTTLQSHVAVSTKRHYDAAKRTGTLWRIKGTALLPLLDGLDAEPRFGWVERPVVATSKGLLIASQDSGPWWLPAAEVAQPFLLDQTQGFLLHNGVDLCRATYDRFFALSNDGRWSLLPLPGDKPLANKTRLSSLRTTDFMVQDSHLHLWAMRAEERDFAEWDGSAWHRRDVPKELVAFNDVEFSTDGHDHGWLVPLDDGKCPVLDFATGKWRIFDSLEKAVDEMLAPGDQLTMRRHSTFAPVSHHNGRKGFLSWTGFAHVNHTGKWTRTDIHIIGGPDARVSGAPFFDADGRFALPLSGKHFQFRDDGKWVEKSDADTSMDRTYVRDEGEPPAGCTVANVISTQLDRHGVAWLTTANGALWKWLDGVALRVKDGDQPLLLRPHTMLAEILSDQANNAFMRRTDGNTLIHYDVIRAKAPPSVTPAKILSIESSTARVILPSGPGIWHRWRLDRSAWQRPNQKAEVKLEGLLPREHRLEIETFDDQLTPIVETQTLTFTVKAAAEGVLAQQLLQLRSDDLDGREAAARVLKAQGVAVLPFLKQSLTNTSNDDVLRWWLKAIIQSIETEQARQK